MRIAAESTLRMPPSLVIFRLTQSAMRSLASATGAATESALLVGLDRHRQRLRRASPREVCRRHGLLDETDCVFLRSSGMPAMMLLAL